MHFSIESLPIGESEFDGHDKHADAAGMFWYAPAAQCKHVPEPFTALNLPSAHAKHDDSPATSRNLPDSHSVHIPDPLTGLYHPTVHAVHAAPSIPS
eukprot:3711069-Rhodomonas_salina.2